MLRNRFPTSLLAVILVLTLGAGTVFSGNGTAQAPLAELDGTVTDPSGSPLEGVTVIAKKQVTGSTWQYHETRTDASGQYTFEGLDVPGAWNLSYQKDGYRTHQETLDLELNESTHHDITLKSLFESTFMGTVRDGETDEAIEGAKIRVQSWAQGEPLERSTTSDAEGAFSITLFPQENQILITKKGYSNYHDWTHGSYGDIQQDSIRLWPAPAQDAVVKGRVVDAQTGAGVQAQVSLRPDWQRQDEATMQGSGADAPEPMIMPRHPGGNNYNSTISDEDGHFRMNAHAGYIVLEANREGYLIARHSVELIDGEEKQATLELEALPEKSVTLSGTVTNANSGDAVVGAQVNVQVPGAGDYAYAQTDAHGKWQVKVRPGFTMVHVHHYGGWYGDYEVMDERTEAVAVEEGAHHEGDDPASNSSASSPQPVEPVPEVRDEGNYYPAVRSLMTKAHSDAHLDIELVPEREPTTTIVGYVVDTQTQQGVAGVQVHLQNHETGGWGSATTDENGSFRFETHAGYHTLGFYGDGYLPNGVNTIAPESGTHRVDIEATQGEWVEAGWWRPGDHDGHHDGYYPMQKGGYAMDEATSDSAMSGESMGRSSMGAPSGDGGLQGGPGGLGPYSGPLENEEAPAPGMLIVLLSVAAAIGVAVRRRTG